MEEWWVSFSRPLLFSLQECWQSWMHITLITKKPSKEKLLGLPQTWIVLIRTQSSLVGCQNQGLWGKVSILFSFAKRKTLRKSDIPLMLLEISEVWSLASDLVICSSPLGSTMELFCLEGELSVFSLHGWFPQQPRALCDRLQQALSTVAWNSAFLIFTCVSLVLPSCH